MTAEAVKKDLPRKRDLPRKTDTLSEAVPDPKRWLALVVLLVAAFMDMLDVTIVNMALPNIQATLDASYAAIQWTMAGYALSFGLLLITGGRLGDVYGRKRMFMIGVSGFTFASLLCGIAAEPWQLAAARILQGAMAAVMVPQVLAIIHVTFPRGERGKAFGMFGAITGLAAILGMVLGGVLTSWNLFGLQWRTIFLINIPIGIFGLIAGARSIRESKAPAGARLDLLGVVLATAGLLLLLFPLVQGRELGWPAWGFVLMAAAVPVLAAFVAHERRIAERGGSPLLPIGLFGVRSFSSGISIHLLFNFGMGIFFMSWTLYMQLGLGWSPWQAGLSGIPFCLGAAPGAGISVAVLLPKFGRKVIQWGALVMVAGLGSYIWVVLAAGPDTNFWYQALPLLVFGVGFGMNAGPLPDIVLTEVPDKDAGAASGLYNTNQQLGAAVGIALASVVYFGMLGGQGRSAIEEVTPRLKQDLVAAGVAEDRANSVVASFTQCAASGEPSRCDQGIAEPAAAQAVAKAGRDTTAITFGSTFSIALGTIIVFILLTLLATPFLPRRVTIRDPDADGAVIV